MNHFFSQRSLDVVFVQEGRLQGDAVHPAQHYQMFRAGATSSGSHGSQIWLAHTLASFVVASRAVSPRIIAGSRASDLAPRARVSIQLLGGMTTQVVIGRLTNAEIHRCRHRECKERTCQSHQ